MKTEYKQKTIMLTQEQIKRVNWLIEDFAPEGYLPMNFSQIIRLALDEGIDNVEKRLKEIHPTKGYTNKK